MIDWPKLAEVIGAVGGLSGFGSLAATAWWRRQDRQLPENLRITVHSVIRATYGLNFWVSYASASSNETLRVRIAVIGGGGKGPLLSKISGQLYDPQTGSVPEAEAS